MVYIIFAQNPLVSNKLAYIDQNIFGRDWRGTRQKERSYQKIFGSVHKNVWKKKTINIIRGIYERH